MAWNPNKPQLSDLIVDSIADIRGNFQELDGLPQVKDALINSRIVEMGTNSNGTYVRWENGLQVVFGEVELGSVSLSAEGSVYASPALTVTLPAAFDTGAYAWHVNSDLGLGNVWAGLGQQAQGNRDLIRFRFFGGSAASVQNQRVSFFAIGRWK